MLTPLYQVLPRKPPGSATWVGPHQAHWSGNQAYNFSHWEWQPCLCPSFGTSPLLSDYLGNSSAESSSRCQSLGSGVVRALFLEERWGPVLPRLEEPASHTNGHSLCLSV